MKKTYLFLLVALLALAIGSWAVATQSAPAQKINPLKIKEMKEAGIANPLEFKHTGPVFARLTKAVPIKQEALGRKHFVGHDGSGTKGPKAGSDDGTIQYDNGVLGALATNYANAAGNRFMQGDTGAPLGTITLNSFSFYFMQDDLANTGMFLSAASYLGGSLLYIRDSAWVGGLLNSGPSFTSPVLNVLPQTAFTTTGVFSNTLFILFWNLNTATSLPVTDDTIPASLNCEADPTKYHGLTCDDFVGTHTFTMQPMNFMIRVNITSAVNLPVELMAYDVK